MRAHGTRACYVFGFEPGSDRSRGCRCEPCSDANRTYARERRRAAHRPDVVVEPAYVDAQEVRLHLRWLQREGVGLRQVAKVSGASRSSLQHLRSGTRRRCTPMQAERVLLVWPVDVADAALVDARPTWRLLDDLLAQGFTRTALASMLGSTAKVPALQVSTTKVTGATARRVAELHRRLMVRVLADRAEARARRQFYRGRAAA